MDATRRLKVSRFATTDSFRAIGCHTCVCFEDNAALVCTTGHDGDAESVEYAQLFAAAPALLAACQAIAKYKTGPTQANRGGWIQDVLAIGEQARAAIKKATPCPLKP